MKSLPKTVLMLGFVSLFTDFSSEMIYPLLPIFLTQVLGAGAISLGLIEGMAEATASFFKILSGVWTDRSRRRKGLVVAGYGLAGLVRPLIGLAGSWTVVLLLRFLDRVGKGLRSSPRDALIADVTQAEIRGAAYGFHRAMDHAGAVIGPLASGALLTLAGLELRTVFFLAAIPAVFALCILIFGIHEAATLPPAENKRWDSESRLHFLTLFGRTHGELRIFLLSLFIFTLGNSTDAFLLLKLSQNGVPAGWIALLWSLHHIDKMTSNVYCGRLSDRVGSKRMVISGWVFYALIYLMFATVESPNLLVFVFLAYGIYYGFVEPAERSLIANLAPASERGTVFGFYHFSIGMGALPASVLFGLIWHWGGAPLAFGTGAALALVAAALLAQSDDKRSGLAPGSPN